MGNPDSMFVNNKQFIFSHNRYSIEQDPAGWFRVDKTTGEIFVKESLDRESSHVTNGTYTVTVLVTEKGKYNCFAFGLQITGNDYIYPSIHPCSKPLVLCRVSEVLEPIPASWAVERDKPYIVY